MIPSSAHTYHKASLEVTRFPPEHLANPMLLLWKLRLLPWLFPGFAGYSLLQQCCAALPMVIGMTKLKLVNSSMLDFETIWFSGVRVEVVFLPQV